MDVVLRSRVGGPSFKAKSPKADGQPFKFWFNTTSDTQTNKSARAHMKKVESWAEETKNNHPAVFQFRFIDKAFADLEIIGP